MPQSTVEASHTIGARPRPPGASLVVIECQPEHRRDVYRTLATLEGVRVVAIEAPMPR